MSLYRHKVCVEPNDDLSRYVPMCAGGGLDIGSPDTPPEDAPAVAAYRNGDNGEPLERTWNQSLSDYMLYNLTKRYDIDIFHFIILIEWLNENTLKTKIWYLWYLLSTLHGCVLWINSLWCFCQ